MTPGQFKGALLEYLIRKLLQKCGFTSVAADGHYVFAQAGSGLFFINGKGAAHDADALMEPPIQMPFSYPSRLLFECKSYGSKVGLNVIRNALGLRYDINEFEIVTDETIRQRRNNRRANYAIANRKRYYYQVGVASVKDFSKPAFEFAGNNKIPLISLSWFLDSNVCDQFDTINEGYLNSLSRELRTSIYAFFKDKRSDSNKLHDFREVEEFIRNDNTAGHIIRSFDSVIQKSFVGLLETGDIIFLFATNLDSFETLDEIAGFDNLSARLHYYEGREEEWYLEINDTYGAQNPEFRFVVPDRIMKQWREYSFDRRNAIELKNTFFSRIFIFRGRQGNNGLPFMVVNLDLEWVDAVRRRLGNNDL